MSYGVTLTGFVKKTLSIILGEIQDDERDLISPTLNMLATAVTGQFNGIFGDKLREAWDVLLAVYRSGYPDSASGDALDGVASITGQVRLRATKSQVTLDQLFVDGGVTIPAGSVVSVGASGARFATLAAVTNAAGYKDTVSVAAEAEEVGQVNGYAGTIDTIQTPIIGWDAKAALTAGNTGPYNINGQTLLVKVDRGTAQTVTFATANPVSAAQAASEIQAQVAGLSASDEGNAPRVYSDTDGSGSSVEVTGGTANALLGFSTDEVKGFNSNDADVGRETETDSAFRLRREQNLRAIGSASLEAIRSRILTEVTGVSQCFGFENTTLITDGAGLPGKSFEMVVQGGDDQDIADKIWETKPAGIETYGSTSKTVTDSQGQTHTIKFSRPTNVPIYIELTADIIADQYPLDGDDQIKQAIADFGDTLEIGEDVVALQFECIPLDIAGVEDVTIFKIDTVTPPVGTSNITINARELATFDTSDIDVATV
jgi:uncharacterized phage protein gp47/JayE